MNTDSELLHPGPVYICENCRALINPNIFTQSVHAHGNTIIKPGKCKFYTCLSDIITSKWYQCPGCNIITHLPVDPEVENLVEDETIGS